MAKYFKDLTDSEFDEFSDNLSSEVTTNAVAWNIPSGNATALATARGVYAPLYSVITNKRNRTASQVQDHREGRGVFETFIEGFANQFINPNPAITDSKKEELGFTVRSADSTSRPAITDDVFVKMESLTDGRMRFICRVTSDGNRASVHPDADGVELRYLVSTTAPASVSQMPNSTVSPKARFMIQTADGSAGMKIFASLRWVNISSPEKNGPWCPRLEGVVLN